MPRLDLWLASGEHALSVRRFTVREALNGLFEISVWAVSAHAQLDFDAILGRPAGLRVTSGLMHAVLGGSRAWTGLCSYIEQLHAEPTGLSTYLLRIVPSLWCLSQRSGFRVVQHLSVPEIAQALLGEWGLEPVLRVDRASHPKLEYRVQYGESDYAFLCRLLEEAGITFGFPADDASGAKLCLFDKPHGVEPRSAPPIPWVDQPNQAAEREFVTNLRVAHGLRSAGVALRGYDFRHPSFAVAADARATGPASSAAVEARLERHEYAPGAFTVEVDRGASGGAATPVADDRAATRSDPRAGATRAACMLESLRADRAVVRFDTNSLDLWPGVVFSIDHHPRADLGPERRLLLVELSIEGDVNDEWKISADAVFADVPYRPAARTPKPRVHGVQPATVVGPSGHEIHTDEFGRVRVQFPWDRHGRHDDGSSCWVRVSQAWAGKGYGAVAIPRVGQEVLVAFADGDPDQPVVVGRVFNGAEPVPYRLPEHGTRSGWKTASSPGAGGSNELMFEDARGRELVYVQAERNLRTLVKRDETATVGGSRQQLVKGSETTVVGAGRTETVGASSTELVGASRLLVVGAGQQRLVKADEVACTEGALSVVIGKDQDLVVKQTRREGVGGDAHLTVRGSRRQRVRGTDSLLVSGARQERVGRRYALEAGTEIHLKAGEAVVIEGVEDLTLAGPGGFIRIDHSGVTIKGRLVKINSGSGTPGVGSGAAPAEPEQPVEAAVPEPAAPQVDDVSRTGVGQ